MRILVAILAVSYCLLTQAQNYDEQWLVGDYNSVIWNFNPGGNILQRVTTINIPSTETLADICDENGNLLYCTNGIYIANSDGDTLLNGTGINPCPYTDAYAGEGLNIPQAALFVPMPGNNRFYYLFHFSADTLNGGRPGTLYYSLIDKEGNSAMGEVVQKNIAILQGVVLRGGGMTACKHANGRDYWIVMPGYDNNIFYKFLLIPNGILGPFTQNIGVIYPGPFDIAYSKFSQNGSAYVTGCAAGLIEILDFDRCSGEFSNATSIYHNASGDPIHQPISGCSSLEFSPNGRFLYVVNSNDLTQYDLLSGNIQDSVELYAPDTADIAGFAMLQIAPNGKLYCSTWNGGYNFMHVINQPDLKGDNCDFVFGGQSSQCINSVNVPNMINYKLGPLIGSGCDTLTSLQETKTKSQEPRIIPNQADKYVYVEMGCQGNYEFELLSAIGQVIDRKETRQVDIFDTEKLSNGVYFIEVIDKNSLNEIVTRKVVVEH
jgi:hypothetical protein